MNRSIQASAGLRELPPEPAMTSFAFGFARADEMRPPLHNRLESIGDFWCPTIKRFLLWICILGLSA